MEEKTISQQTLRRLPAYLHYLKRISHTQGTISATGLAAVFGLNDVQVRKDLGSVSGSGRPKTGYVIEELVKEIEQCLGCDTETQTILIGAGHLGQALLAFTGFDDFGLTIIAAFDTSPDVVGKMINGKPVLPMEDLETVCEGKNISLAILTIPETDAQAVADRLAGCGVRAIWNFAPTILRVPPTVCVENENLASSLAILSKHLRDREEKSE